MTDPSPEPRIIKGSDIIFECPNCSKSMAIDFNGAGLMINCPECELPIQVPGEVDQDGFQQLEQTVTISQEKVQLLVESFDEINSRREKLERMKTDTFSRLERIHEQLSIIQSAIDRITLIIQESAAKR